MPPGRLLVKFGIEHLAHRNQQFNCIPSVLRINSLLKGQRFSLLWNHGALTGQVQHQQILKAFFQHTDGRCHPAQASVWQGVVLQEKPFHTGRRDTNMYFMVIISDSFAKCPRALCQKGHPLPNPYRLTGKSSEKGAWVSRINKYLYISLLAQQKHYLSSYSHSSSDKLILEPNICQQRQ